MKNDVRFEEEEEKGRNQMHIKNERGITARQWDGSGCEEEPFIRTVRKGVGLLG